MCVAWHWRPETTSIAGWIWIRMARSMMHLTRPIDESWLEWHRRMWRALNAEVTAAQGADPTTIVVTCVASGVGRMVARPVVGRTWLWRAAT